MRNEASFRGRNEAGRAAGAAGRRNRAKRTQFADLGTALRAPLPELASFVQHWRARLHPEGKRLRWRADGT